MKKFPILSKIKALNDSLATKVSGSQFAVIHTDVSGGGGTATMAYPTGFAWNNCFAVACFSQIFGERYYTDDVVFAELFPAYVRVTHKGASSDVTGTVNVLLFKP